MLDIRDYGYSTIQIEINNTCNMRCTFCPLPIRNLPNKTMEVSDVKALLGKIATYKGVDKVAFHQYGEPLINANIFEYLDEARRLGLRTQLVTNGLALNAKNIDGLIKHAPTIMRISAQVIDPKHHEELRGVTLKADKYLTGLATAIAAFYDAQIGTEELRIDIAVNDDKGGIRGLKRVLKAKLGVAINGDPTIYDASPRTLAPHLESLLQQIEQKSKTFKYSREQLDRNLEKYYNSPNVVDLAYALGRNFEITFKHFYNGRRISEYYPIQRGTCGTPIIGILADGTVSMCCQDYEGFTSMGNIFKDDLSDILSRNKKIIDGVQRTGELYHEGCKKCLGAPTALGAKLKDAAFNVRQVRRKIRDLVGAGPKKAVPEATVSGLES